MSTPQTSHILLVTAEKGFFGQQRKPWVTMDVPLLANTISSLGYKVQILDVAAINRNATNIKDQTIFYAFSQREHLRAYIKDVMQILAHQNRLIPSLDLLMCHENKGYAELYRNTLGIVSPRGLYLSDVSDIAMSDLGYPVVLKTISGTNANGVWLCASEKHLRKAVQSLSPKVSVATRLDYLRRKTLRKGRSYEGYPDFEPASDANAWLEYMTPKSTFLLQEFIPGLDCDYRVIAISERYYLMKRMVNKGDFRASGTKRFVFDVQAPPDLMDYAEHTFRLFRTPFLSMDIGHSDSGNHLFEFQALHFGTAAIVRSAGYYERLENTWHFVPAKPILEEVIAQGLDRYLRGME